MNEQNKFIIDKFKFDISEEDFNEVMSIYNNLMFYYKDVISSKMEIKDCFKFFYNNLEECNESVYYKIFNSLVIMKKKGLLKYVDYCFARHYMLTDSFKVSFIERLSNFLKFVLSEHNKAGDGFIFTLYDRYDYVIEREVKESYKLFLSSNSVSDDYKKLYQKFKDFFNLYYDYVSGICYEAEEMYDICFNNYLNCIYYYFLVNGILKNDLKRANEFLDYINKDIWGTIDRINLYKLDDIRKMFIYIDSMYKSFDSKVKAIE